MCRKTTPRVQRSLSSPPPLQRTLTARGLGPCSGHQRLPWYQLRPTGPGTKDGQEGLEQDLSGFCSCLHLLCDTGQRRMGTVAPAPRVGGKEGTARKGSGPAPTPWGVSKSLAGLSL